MLPRPKILAAMLASGLLLSGVASAAEEGYPSEPIKIIHGSSAGAPQDVMLRQLAPHLEEAAGVPIVVEPRPGGSAQVAMAYLKGQPADGYTILNEATGITSVLQLPGAAHEWQDFTPLYRIQLDPFALYVQRDGNYATLEEFIAAMKEQPGMIRIGGYGSGSPHQLTALAMAAEAGVKMVWVPFSSGTDAINAVMGGEIDAAMSNISVYGRFKERTKVLAVTSEEKLEAHPKVPTFRDEGFDLARYHWRGMFVKEGTPPEIVDELNRLVGEAVQSEGFQQYLAESSTLPGDMPRTEFEQMLQEQAEADRKTLTEIDMLPE